MDTKALKESFKSETLATIRHCANVKYDYRNDKEILLRGLYEVFVKVYGVEPTSGEGIEFARAMLDTYVETTGAKLSDADRLAMLNVSR